MKTFFTYTQIDSNHTVKITKGDLIIGEFYMEVDGDWVLEFVQKSGFWSWFAIQEISDELIKLNIKQGNLSQDDFEHLYK